MKKVIITGANGFIGSHLVSKLSDIGVEVIALVDPRYDYSHLSSRNGVTTIEFTLQSIDLLKNNNLLYNSDVIFHLAWSGVNATFRNDESEQLQNIHYGLNVIKLAKHLNVSKVLIPGSAAEVSCGDGVITGNEQPAPSDIYSATKVATRYLCQVYALQNNVVLIWPLITSIYGPGRDDNNLISYAIKSLLVEEKPSFTKLEQKWDYLYIDDLIEALIALGALGTGGVYPLGSGESRQLKDYVNVIRDIINPSLELGIGDLPYKNPNKIDNQIMDISRLIKETSFTPKVHFNEGIKNTISYFKSLLEKDV